MRGHRDDGAGDPQPTSGLGRCPGDRACPGVRLPLPLARRAARRPARPALPAGALRLVQPAVVDRAGGRAAGRGGTVAGAAGRRPAEPAGPRRTAPRPDLRGGRPAVRAARGVTAHQEADDRTPGLVMDLHAVADAYAALPP